jgi:RNA polymerase sigma-70 factor (ECF subfamily)
LTRAVSASIGEIIESHLGRVYHFCSRMTMSADDAQAAAFETFERAAQGLSDVPVDATALELWLLKIASFVMERRLSAAAEVDFDLLDETLRSEDTRTHEVHSLSQPEREFYLWELKQGCMTAVVNCLSPGERVAFVLSSVMSRSDEDAAAALGIKVSAFKVRLSRARKKVGDYLAPRCEHVDPRNPCHCPSRIGIALDKGFIAPPQTAVVHLRKRRPFDQEIRSRDATRIFQSLPEPEVPPELVAKLKNAAWAGPASAAASPPRR